MKYLRLAGVCLWAGGRLAAVEFDPVVPADATPAAREAAAGVVAAMRAAEPKVAGALGVPEAERAKRVRVVFQKMPGVAHASGGEIRFSLERVESHAADSRGAGVHELAHILQAYPEGVYAGDNVWVIEGMADYVRFGVCGGGDYGFSHDPKSHRFDSSYRVTGRFLGWCEARNPGVVKALHGTLRARGSGAAAWAKHCGKPLPELWAEYDRAMRAAGGRCP